MPGAELRAWARREEAAEELKSGDWADVSSSVIAEVVNGADLVVLCMPVEFMAGTVAAFPQKSGTQRLLVTDVGSVKRSVVNAIGASVTEKGGVFLGSHPMAGSEKSGMDHASEDLYVNAPVIMTPDGNSAEMEACVKDLRHFWETVGGKVSVMSPDEHDEVVAAISHLPHVVAASLVNTVLENDSTVSRFSGGGFRDTTRVAAGHAEMWTGILLENREAVLHQLNAYSSELEKWKEALGSLDRDRLRSFLTRASSLRNDS